MEKKREESETPLRLGLGGRRPTAAVGDNKVQAGLEYLYKAVSNLDSADMPTWWATSELRKLEEEIKGYPTCM